MRAHLLRSSLLLCLWLSVNLLAYPQTKGTPLGGIGTGYVKFDARTGNIAASSRIPPGAGDMMCEFPVRMSTSGGFHFFAGGQAVSNAKTDNEDAKCPLYTADFGKTNNVQFNLNAFGPFIPGDNDLAVQLAASPAALFEITAKNEGTEAIDVGVALEFANKSSGVAGLLGGMSDATIDPVSANRGIIYATSAFSGDLSPGNNAANTGNAYMLAGCSKDGATFSAGAVGTFATSGTLSNTDGNAVAAKCSIGPGETVSFKFVLSWWRTFVSAQDRYAVGKDDDDNYYYHNFYPDAKAAGSFCMQHFDAVRNSVISMVSRVMASNFPQWFLDRLFNNTYPLVHNSFWAKDGRAAYWEGKYGIIGTIDQGEHAAIWYTHNWPRNQWLELAYWLSNQFLDPAVLGQIHHDFNISPGMTFSPPESRFMAPWDHWNRADYWFDPNTTHWSDLNSMLIFKAYELMLVTGDRDSLQKHFPKVLLTAERLLNMCKEANAYIPITSKSTYDSDGSLTPQYASGCAVAAFNCVADMAAFVGDDVTAAKYQDVYVKSRKDYKDKLFNSEYGNIMNMGWGEGHVGGYSWANYFCLPPIQDKDFIETGCERLWNMYSTATDLKTRIGGWHYYTYDHLGGALTAIGQADRALKFHEWDHDANYKAYPDQIFWQELFSQEIGPQKYTSYMTGPNIWRSYFQFMGYLLDRAHGRLYIRPSLPTEMGNIVTNAALPNPYAWGTLNYNGNGNPAQNSSQEIVVAYDMPTAVNEIILKNNTDVAAPLVPNVLVSGSSGAITDFLLTREDYDVEKNVRIRFLNPVTIGPEGIAISMLKEGVGIKAGRKLFTRETRSIFSSHLSAGTPIRCSIDRPGKVSIDLLALNGAKIGTLVEQNITTTGNHSFRWNGRTIEGNNIGAVVGIIRLSTTGGTSSKVVFNVLK